MLKNLTLTVSCFFSRLAGSADPVARTPARSSFCWDSQAWNALLRDQDCPVDPCKAHSPLWTPSTGQLSLEGGFLEEVLQVFHTNWTLTEWICSFDDH